ncbi:MAG: hypothetical protein ACYTG5_11205 [Planctomycetota bacterium]|jgi:hypothetical protein
MEAIESKQEITALVTAFEDLTLPREEWTHAAHLAVGLVYVLRYGPVGTVNRLRLRIPAYNRATGRSDGERDGYRDDVTVFFVWEIHSAIRRREHEDLPKLLAELCAGPLGKRGKPVGKSA